ncbi:MAG: hypothetical protein SFV17_10295 [Candidatus Obscuribacter sp.]|nr:hypothetical protein [Candidatus Obscuribacter sp.]
MKMPERRALMGKPFSESLPGIGRNQFATPLIIVIIVFRAEKLDRCLDEIPTKQEESRCSRNDHRIEDDQHFSQRGAFHFQKKLGDLGGDVELLTHTLAEFHGGGHISSNIIFVVSIRVTPIQFMTREGQKRDDVTGVIREDAIVLRLPVQVAFEDPPVFVKLQAKLIEQIRH